MKTFLSVTVLFISLHLVSCGEKEASTKSTQNSTPVQQSNVSTPVNKYCMIESGNEIDPRVTIVYGGKTYGFCCKECIPKFQKEPAKYIARFEAKQNEQKTK